MRHLPFKALILCVLLPPLVYVFSIQLLEKTIHARYNAELAAVYTGDDRQLFDGSVRLQEVIRENVDAFMSSRRLPAWGVRVNVTVKTHDGIYLYPDAYDNPKSDLSAPDSFAVARENFRLLNEGLIKTIDVEIEHNTLLANAILAACVLVSLMVLFGFYRRGMRLLHQEELARQEVIDDLASGRQKSLTELERLKSQRVSLSRKIELINAELDREREKSSAAEEEMMDELVALEEKISQNLDRQDRQLQEIDELKQKIKQFEKDNEAKNRQLRKNADAVRKRFGALYKNTAFHDRAVEGVAELSEAMKIKAEEVIHQLNDDPKMVPIKRKVFGKKNRATVFEVIFAYKGRLYFRNIPGSRVEVLAVGTKLTQNKDLAFLDKL
ncbi:coiled-coil domain-containing protein [Desulfosarcina sp.]|uniref:coiled-coil domain-containing protein n=1 Tax=Desulfosarcina sp. TaxID=2027861 RepID=UPI003970E558